MERKGGRPPVSRLPPRNENKNVLGQAGLGVVGVGKSKKAPVVSNSGFSKLEEVKKPLRNSSTAINRQSSLRAGGANQSEEQKGQMQKTGYTEKPSDRFKKVKAADPFTSGKKHKTNFGYVYSSGGVPIRINHGTVRNTIQWDRQPSEVDYDPLLVNCFEGLLETEHPYALCAYRGLIEMLEAPGAADKTIPLVQKLIMPLRNAFMSTDKEIYEKGLESLKLLSQTVGHNLTAHMHILLAQLNKKMTTKPMREKIMGVLNTLEENGGKEALDVLKQKIPTYTSIYS